jgi:hypothetical protein
MESSRALEVRPGPGCLKSHGPSIRVAYCIAAEREMVRAPISLLPIEATHNHSGKLLYQIQGSDKWIDELGFRRHCDTNVR